MQFGKTLVGGIIGAVLGIALLIVVYLVAGIDKMWMAIPVAVLTGLGVRMVAVTKGNASYLRGAITVLLAMGAYLGGLAVTRAVANNRAEKVAKANPPRAIAEAPSEPGGDGDAKTEPAAEAPAPTPLATTSASASSHRPAMPGQFSTWDFISLAVAALFAYELGRGSESAGREHAIAESGGQAPTGMHPDA
jgi:hypothetical protein